jgi:hypothetical protein
VSPIRARKRAEVKKALLHAGSGGVVMVVTFAPSGYDLVLCLRGTAQCLLP